MRIGVERTLRIEADKLEEFLGGTGASALGELLHLGANKHGRVQGRQSVLVDHGDLTAAQRVLLLLRHGEQVLAVVDDLAGNLGLGVEQAHDGQRRDGLAAAGLADQAHGLMGADLEAHVVDDVDVSVARELDAEVLTSRMGGSHRCAPRSGRCACPRFPSGRQGASPKISAWASYARTGLATSLSASRSLLRLESLGLMAALGAAAMASVMPSERMFRHRTVIMMARPGNSACHQRPAKTPSRASARILPHVA